MIQLIEKVQIYIKPSHLICFHMILHVRAKGVVFKKIDGHTHIYGKLIALIL